MARLGKSFYSLFNQGKSLNSNKSRGGWEGRGSASRLGEREHFYKQTLKIKTRTKSNKRLLSTSFFLSFFLEAPDRLNSLPA